MKAIYAFSGDPITHGHIDIVERAAATYSSVVVAIGENPRKSGRYTFSREHRLGMARHSLAHLPNVSCEVFHGLLAEHAYRHGIDVIVRGVRNGSDLENELVQFAVNESLHPSLDTVFLPARHRLAHISSSVVKAIVSEGGDVSAYCPLHVKEALERVLLQRYTVGIAGGIASGKSHFAAALARAISGQGAHATVVSLDRIGHHVLGAAADPIYRDTRQQIASRFGLALLREDSSIDRRGLGRIVFNDTAALDELNAIMREPMLARLYEETRILPHGILLLEGAILVEGGWSRLVNNNVILVDAPDQVRLDRLVTRDRIPLNEARLKIARQIDPAARRDQLRERIDSARWGNIWEVEDSGSRETADRLAADIISRAGLPATFSTTP